MPIFLFFLIMNTEFKDTEIFSPIVRTAVAVSDTGKVFLFDRDENRILMYAGNGEKLGSFGRKGQGPGEFNYPMGIRIVDGHIFVLDFTGQQGYCRTLDKSTRSSGSTHLRLDREAG